MNHDMDLNETKQDLKDGQMKHVQFGMFEGDLSLLGANDRNRTGNSAIIGPGMSWDLLACQFTRAVNETKPQPPARTARKSSAVRRF